MLELSQTALLPAPDFPQAKNPISLLLIEDQRLHAPVFETLIAGSDAGYPTSDHKILIHLAENISRGLETLAQGGIDVILLRVWARGKIGLKWFFQLHDGEPGIPVVILSDVMDEAQGIQAIHAGAQDYLLREQLTGEQLVRSLRYAIGRHDLLRKVSLTDDLTNLLNRRGFITLAEQQLKMARAHRTKAPLLLAFVDIDGLKQINDRFGHKAGSDAIRHAAETLRTTFREVDIIGRLGGDEFGILVVHAITDDGESILSRLMENVAALNRKKAGSYDLSLSMGLIEVEPDRVATIEDLIAKADSAMYEQKRGKITRSIPGGDPVWSNRG